MVSADLSLTKNLDGPILDLGGGGEGVIGRIYGSQAVAIDNRQEELDEAPEGPQKMLMDAAALTFEDNSFQHVTSFFSFLYMSSAIQTQAVAQAARVLRPGGSLHIWDAEVESAFPDPFLIELDIDAAGTAVHTTYGVVKESASQDAGHFIRLCQSTRLKLADRQEHNGWFYLRFTK
ncbi:MAG: class I SAM-dependent methyltransferase [Clostridiales bacterium]|nr:class I SAM-dependent methyltransferase [Clostridiales bacterium]